jgi:HEAT repeat protein
LASLHALGSFAETSALDAIRACLHDDEPEIRAEAVWALSQYDLPESWLVSNVRTCLQDPDPLPVAFAAVALFGKSGAGHAAAAAKKLQESPEPAGRMALARALERATSPEASTFLENLLRDPQLEVREAAVVATRKIQHPEVVEFLGNLLTEEDEQVAIAAIETVGRLGMDQYNDLLVLLVDQAESSRVLATMLVCLGRLGFVESVPTVAFYLTHDDPRVRANAVQALEFLRDPKSTSLVHLSLNDPHPRVVSNAIKALWGWGELRVRRLLGKMLQGTAGQRLAACHALGEMVYHSRVEASLVDSPLLVTALRQVPKYQELRRMFGV